jgi:hypothetical protein
LLVYAGPKPTPMREVFPRPEKGPAASPAEPAISRPDPPQPAPAPAIELPSWWQPGRR